MTTTQSTTSMFSQALDVINTSLDKHADHTPYKQLLAASDKILGDSKIGVAVHDGNPRQPFDYFTIRYKNHSFELLQRGKSQPDVAWSVSRDYLQSVVSNAEDYIEHPAKLDWDWLKDRVGLD